MAGPTFETLPWERAHASGRLVPRREAARGRRGARGPPGRGPIPTTTTAPPADRATAAGLGAGRCARPTCGCMVRNGSGRAERRRQHLAGAPAEGLRERRRREQPRRARRPQRDPLRARPTWPRPSSCGASCPARSWCEDSSPSGTDIVLVAREGLHGLGSTGDHRRSRRRRPRRCRPKRPASETGRSRANVGAGGQHGQQCRTRRHRAPALARLLGPARDRGRHREPVHDQRGGAGRPRHRRPGRRRSSGSSGSHAGAGTARRRQLPHHRVRHASVRRTTRATPLRSAIRTTPTTASRASAPTR